MVEEEMTVVVNLEDGGEEGDDVLVWRFVCVGVSD